MFILFLCVLARGLTLRGIAKELNAKDNVTALTLWQFLFVLIMTPFCYPLLLDAMPTLLAHPWIFAVALLKGVVLWGGLFMMQFIRRESTSASEFRGPLSLGFLAIVNSFLGEDLSQMQWISVGALWMLGVLFTLRGHLSTLPPVYLIVFCIFVINGCLPGATDQIVITQTNWYVQLLGSTISMVCVAAILNRRSSIWVQAFTQPKAMLAGGCWGATEVIILMLLVAWVPVTMGVMAMSMASPTLMLIASLKWNEGNWRQQLAFGSAAYVAILPLILA